MPYIEEPVLKNGGKLVAKTRTVERFVVDNPAVHDKSGEWIVTGKAEFAADHFTGHKYFAVPKMATIMHGDVVKVDATEALKIEGVKAVLTAADVPTWSSHIDQWGQEVACVVADNWYTAIRATEAVKVEYKELTGVFDPDKAIEAYEAGKETDLVGTLKGTNIHERAYSANYVDYSPWVRNGGYEAGLEGTDWEYEFEYPWTTSYAHQELEAHQATGWWIGDEAYVYCGSQDPYSTRTGIFNNVKALWGTIPQHKIHVYSRFNCGGFGGKTDDWGVYGALAASKALGGVPVLYKNTRQSNGVCRQRSFSIRSKIKFAGTKDGKIKATDVLMYANEGRNTGAPVGDCIFGARFTWNIPYANFSVLGVQTNSGKRYYWRDVADPPGGYNFESALEKLAYKLGMNPLELRLKNVNDNDAIKEGTTQHWGSFVIKDLLNYVAEWSEYNKKFHLPATKKVKDLYPNDFKEYADWYHGIALTSHIDSHGGSSGSSRGAIAKANTDGTFQVITGSARGTAGGTTVCCNAFAEALGAKNEDVLLGDWSNTDTGLNPGVQASSSHTISMSSAYYNCGKEMKYKILTLALTKAPFKGVAKSVDELDTKNSEVYLKADPTQKIAFSALSIGNAYAATAYGYNAGSADNPTDLQKLTGQRNGGAWKDKEYNGKKYISVGDAVATNGQSGACLEVAVDPETGITEILNYYLAVDTGCTIFKQGALREIGAATELIHSQAFFFGDVYDEATGADISSLYTEAQFPTYMDMDFSTHHFTDYQSEDAGGPFGCHGIAEPSLTNFCTVSLAIFNAIGLWVNHEKGGQTADKVLKAINERHIGADYEALMKA